MQAYSYNQDGRYIGPYECQLDPVATKQAGEAVYLLPANATWTAPPEHDPETERAVWDGEIWTLVEIPQPEPEPEPEPEPPEVQQMQAAIRLSMMQAQALPDTQALAVPELYPAWEAGTAYGGEGQTQIVSRPNRHLYRCQQAHTSQEGWEPENVPALWVVIAASEAGTIDDPILAARGMEYEYGKYYKDPEDGKIYLCTRTGEAEGGTVVLQYLPHELIGHYFQSAE